MKSSPPSPVVPEVEADADSGNGGSFLSRWSRRKAAVREGKAVPAEPVQPAAPLAPGPDAAPARVGALAESGAAADAPPLPTLADVALLKPGDAIQRFVARGVDEQVKRAALKTLFADPHFNVMDGLDIYIDDYSKSDPIPPHILRQMRQSEALGLFDPIEDEVAAAGQAAEAVPGEDGTEAGTDVGSEVGSDVGTEADADADAAQPQAELPAPDAVAGDIPPRQADSLHSAAAGPPAPAIAAPASAAPPDDAAAAPSRAEATDKPA